MTFAATANGIRDVDAQAHVALLDEPVTALLRTRDQRWCAVVDRTTIVAGGPSADWERLAAGTGLTCLAADGDRLLVGGDDARLFTVGDGALEPVAGFEDAPGRADWYTPWGGPPSVRSIAVDDDGAWYVNVHVGGILRSRDAGGSFEQLVDPDVDVHQVIAVDGSLVAACGAGGVMLSRDAGDTWRHLTRGLHADYCRAVAVPTGTLLVSASTGPRTDRGALYRLDLDAPDDGFERCELGLPEWFEGNVDTFWLDANGGRAAAAAPGGRVYLSSDGGRTWLLADGGLRGVSAVVATSGRDGQE